jgi:hypothetical protein
MPSELDPAWLVGGPVFRACEVDKSARLQNPNVLIDFRPAPPLSQSCFAVLLNLVVDSSGMPETATARIARTNAPEFAEAVLASLPQWRFWPALKNGVPVRQIVSIGRAMTVSIRTPGATPTGPPHATPCRP